MIAMFRCRLLSEFEADRAVGDGDAVSAAADSADRADEDDAAVEETATEEEDDVAEPLVEEDVADAELAVLDAASGDSIELRSWIPIDSRAPRLSSCRGLRMLSSCHWAMISPIISEASQKSRIVLLCIELDYVVESWNQAAIIANNCLAE